MIILSIDPGYDRLGVAVIQKEKGQKEELIFSDCFSVKNKNPFSGALAEVGTYVRDMLKTYQPQEVVIETLIFSTNKTTAFRIAEVRGVILYESALHKSTIFEYNPLTIKVAITGNGRSDKKAFMNFVPKLISLPKKEMLDDEIDAIAIGLTHFAHKKQSSL